jgi:hypothetical protein
MAQYKLLQAAYIDNILHGEDDVVTVSDDLIPGPHMVPVDAAAKKKAAEIDLKNESVTDFVDTMTGGVDVRAFGASPQIRSGMLADGSTSDMLGVDALQQY